MREAFDIDSSVNTDDLIYRSYPAWNSIGHMMLVAALEDEFQAMLATEEILAMSNYNKVVEIMAKYDDKF
jgi:acyl carrier protein